MSRVADSSFLIATMDEDDPRRPEARERAGDPAPILVPPEVLGETIGVIQARVGHEAARTVWDGLGHLPNLVFLNSTQGDEIAGVFLEADGDLSWVDAAVVVHCEREDAEPLCFDPAIEAVYRERGG